MVSMLWQWCVFTHFAHHSKFSQVSENKRTSNYYFNSFTWLKILIISDSSLSLHFPPALRADQFLNLDRFFFSSIPRCLLFYSHSQPSSGTSSMVIFCNINIVYTLFLCCQSPVSIILWTVKMIQLGTLIRKADARSYSWQGQAQGICQNCKTTSLEIGTEKIVFSAVSHGRRQIAWLGHI